MPVSDKSKRCVEYISFVGSIIDRDFRIEIAEEKRGSQN
jgi:hypothetical protein